MFEGVFSHTECHSSATRRATSVQECKFCDFLVLVCLKEESCSKVCSLTHLRTTVYNILTKRMCMYNIHIHTKRNSLPGPLLLKNTVKFLKNRVCVLSPDTV